jgi:preprotein translocase subunit YajC
MHPLSLLLLQAPAPAPSNPLLQFLPVILIGAIFYLLVFRPMQRQKKQQAEMLASLGTGSEVVTTGGIVGTVVNISGDLLVIRVKPDNIKLQIARSAVSGMVSADKTPVGEKK